MKRKRIYVAATRQNDGKTIAALGLIAAFKKKVDKVGYIKPVGQHYLEIGTHLIDKDAILMKKVFDLEGELPDMSPVAVPRGFTEEYILAGDRQRLIERIKRGYENVAAGKDMVVIEGTGHAGVGSVFDMSNADTAQILDTKVVLVSCGGIGKPIDEIMLNKACFDQSGVEILGVIINKVQPEKLDKIKKFIKPGLERKGIKLFGVIPYSRNLSNPTIGQLMEDIKGELLSGKAGLETTVDNFVVGAMPPHTALDYFGAGTLLITPGNREDIILAALSGTILGEQAGYSVAGVILTGGICPHPAVCKLAEKSGIPMVLAAEDTFSIATQISDLIVKIRPEDTEKVKMAVEMIAKYVEVEKIFEELNK
jgi:BioD-like phosphotransacetylase family protein